MFFHNGRLKSLRDVIRFYNTRDTRPEDWYPVTDGVVQKFDDLPPVYRGNIDSQAPLDGRARGSAPAMSEQDMADLEAFLQTLSDADLQAPPPGGSACAAILFENRRALTSPPNTRQRPPFQRMPKATEGL